MSSPALVPDSFLRGILSEFGIQWTQIAILSGVAFSSFGLEKYLNAGVWILGTLIGLSSVFFFRHQVSARLGRVAWFALPIAAAIVGAPIWILQHNSLPVIQYLADHRPQATLYLSIGVMLPVGVLIISYRKQQDLYGQNYPDPLKDAIRSYIAAGIFYREDQKYLVHVKEATSDTVLFKTTLEYTLHNRTRIPQKWSGGLLSSYKYNDTGALKCTAAEIDGQSIDVTDRDYHSNRGFELNLTIDGFASKTLKFEAEETLPQNSSELFTAYLAATGLTLRVENPIEDLVDVHVVSLLPDKVLPTFDGKCKIYTAPSGVLPYQGFRLYWKLRDPTSTHASPAGVPA